MSPEARKPKRGKRLEQDRKAVEVAREERRKKVAANLLAGLNYRDMAEALGVGISTISADAKVILARWKAEQVRDIDQWLSMEVRRLDRATNAIWSDVQAGNLAAIDRLLRLMERRARYLGLDAAAKIDIEVKVREMATALGMDPDAAVAEALRIVEESAVR